jgi:hypothetical protein
MKMTLPAFNGFQKTLTREIVRIGLLSAAHPACINPALAAR